MENEDRGAGLEARRVSKIKTPASLGLFRGHLLWFELTGSLILMLLISGAITLVGTQARAKSQISTTAQNRDAGIAQAISKLFAQYYEENGSWMGSERLVNLVEGSWLESNNDLFSVEVNPEHLDYLIADEKGVIIYRSGPNFSASPPQRISSTLAAKPGIPIVLDGKTIGLLYVRSMVQFTLTKREQAFLKDLSGSILVSIGLGTIAAILLGSLILIRVTRPVSRLAAASRRIASGNFDTQVQVSRRDEIGSLARSFNAMAQELKRAEEKRKAFIADIAHELRTPLTLIQGNLELIQNGLYEADRARIDSLYEESRLLTQLIEGLDTLGNFNPVPQAGDQGKTDISALIRELHMEFAASFRQSGMTLKSDPGPQPILVRGDALRLREALQNIFSNAMKYAGTGSELAVSVYREGRKVELSFRDSGVGVPRESLNRIFDRFYRVEPSRNRETGGSGIGLAITKRIVEGYGGTVAARNVDPHGLEIRVALKLASNQ